ncbi:putative phage abortive infection protein [Providencia rettgeri]|uniref:putative phage abortive infection protein n=1 Tax=Providencia rettgeri TaxID=587 RepID=UPI00257432F4|nr:putative phage abortive infection protein [Providencia rettgeri]MDL9981750.1 putative phage abortive infection protein [Providencia rettgeri]
MPDYIIEVVTDYWTKSTAIAAILAFFMSLCGLRISIKSSRAASFENTFNLLLTQHNAELNKIYSYLNELKSSESKDNDLSRFIISKLLKGKTPYDRTSVDDVSIDLIVWHIRNNKNLSTYFRVLYHLLKYIQNADYTNKTLKNKKIYSSLVRSYINDDLLWLLAINTLLVDDKSGVSGSSDYGKYRKLLIDFDFFEHARFPPAGEVYKKISHSIIDFKRDNKIEDISKIDFNYKNIISFSRMSMLVKLTYDKSVDMEEIRDLSLDGLEYWFNETNDDIYHIPITLNSNEVEKIKSAISDLISKGHKGLL